MAGYVYLIGSREQHWYKIGRSLTPNIRIEDIGILLPFCVEIFAIWRAEDHVLLEKALHEKYAPQHVRGEWFKFRDRKLHQIVFEDLPSAARIYPKNEEDDTQRDLSKVRGVKLGDARSRGDAQKWVFWRINQKIAKKLKVGLPLSPSEQKFYEERNGLTP
jgi:Meiotically up-regulated gene 113